MNIREMNVNGQKIIPSLELSMEKGKVLGIQTNVQRKKILLAQFAEREMPICRLRNKANTRV